MKKEYIKKHGNELVAYDSTDTYKPLVVCFFDEENVLTYDVNRDKYNLVKHNYIASKDDSAFTITGKRYFLGEFVRVNSVWSSGIPNTIEEWKKQFIE